MLNEQVVIFEGPDMTGKTNIAIELSRKLKLGYFKNSNELSSFNKEPDYFKNVLRNIAKNCR
jgi:DNA helicase TIP49 (TBP-interacting protein)